MKVIQTEYKGYLFRSRLEARWAVFFDGLMIDWKYEDEGYILNDGTWYLPDFYLPTFNGGMYVEVKPSFAMDEKQKCRDLCYDSGKDVWLAEGVPTERAYVYLSKDELNDGVVYMRGIPNHDKAFLQNRMFEEPDYDGMGLGYVIPKGNLCYGPLCQAAKDAKQARFEHRKK